MNSAALDNFISQSMERSRALSDPADCVLALAPLMLDLIEHPAAFSNQSTTSVTRITTLAT